MAAKRAWSGAGNNGRAVPEAAPEQGGGERSSSERETGALFFAEEEEAAASPNPLIALPDDDDDAGGGVPNDHGSRRGRIRTSTRSLGGDRASRRRVAGEADR